ncbi:hypothetical protein [Streptomyces sp. Isolate_219]|uniref:hypothetical protein n=1 Tax=Streptomyces sp. Isolate_219 TaxID=2950110 RepID=UPI0021C9F6E6|nr:hypothetical protein [Streptomyces sp. Isolate_219]MCR8576148.1 hypothetical protein [Streptomyces sp. Isolate_219]
MELGPVGRDYWVTGDREQAEDNGSAFVTAFRRLGIDLPDIEIKEPCNDCHIRRTDHRINVGQLSVAEAGEFAEKIDQAMDQLAQYRKLYGPLKESATEDPAG